MRSAWALTIVILAGCGQASQFMPVTVDPALAPYLASFERDIGASTAGISAAFADTETQANPLGETIGECITWVDDSGTVVARNIQVDAAYWAGASADARLELMYHELGHCALNMQHITTFQGNGCPTSIMYPYEFGDAWQGSPCFASEMSYYFSELSSHK
jgi:hypothetical protein